MTTVEGEEDLLQDKPTKRDGLSDRQMFAYAIGHFNNDLCASMWFIYLNYYLLYVVGLS